GHEVGPVVGEVDRRGDADARGQVEAADARRRFQHPEDVRGHRREPGGLLDDRVEVLELHHVLGLHGPPVEDAPELGAHLLEDVRPGEHVIEHPRERRRRGLVAGHEEREHLVQELLVPHRLAMLVTRVDQHRQHVGAAAGPLFAAPCDLCQEHGREVPPIPHEAAPGRETPEVDAQRRDEEERRSRAVGEGEESEETRPQARELLPLVDPEDGAQDHVERDRLQLAVNRERTAEGPGVDHAAGDLPHDAREGGRRAAAEGGGSSRGSGSMGYPSLPATRRSAREQALHGDIGVERQHGLVRVVPLVVHLVERVASDEEDERRALGVDVAQRPLADAVADDVGHHGDILLHELLVQLVDERRKDDLLVAPEDGVDQGVLAVELEARLGEAAEPLDRGPGAGEGLAGACEPGLVQLAYDRAKDVFLALEVAVDRAGGDARLARDLRDAGAPVAEGREAPVGSGEDALARGGSRLHDRRSWHSERVIQSFIPCQYRETWPLGGTPDLRPLHARLRPLRYASEYYYKEYRWLIE